jgi:hypothetical protein
MVLANPTGVFAARHFMAATWGFAAAIANLEGGTNRAVAD